MLVGGVLVMYGWGFWGGVVKLLIVFVIGLLVGCVSMSYLVVLVSVVNDDYSYIIGVGDLLSI